MNNTPIEIIMKPNTWLPAYEEREIYNGGGFTYVRHVGWKCPHCNYIDYFWEEVYPPHPFCAECGTKLNYEDKNYPNHLDTTILPIVRIEE